MIFKKNRVEEDLEKIKNANLPYVHSSIKNDEPKIEDEDKLKLEKGDLLAMTLAVMSLILPYIIAFVGIMLGVVFLLSKFYS